MDKDKTATLAALSPTLAVLLMTFSAVWVNQPFEANRPAEPANYRIPAAQLQDVDARLWQDPFSAILAPKTEKIPATVDRGVAALSEAITEARQRSLTTLGIMTVAGNYVGAAEQRMRTRYAVITALHTAGYVPVNEDHVGAFFLAKPLSIEVPFEWFEHDPLDSEKNGGKVLLLWLNEEALRSGATTKDASPIWQNLNTLFQRLTPSTARGTVETHPSHTILIGPTSSSTLRLMLTNDVPEKLPIDEVYSPAATASRVKLNVQSDEKFSRASPHLTRMVVTDDEIARGLVQELLLRNVRPGDSVGIIYQRDTLYSRAVKLEVEQNLALHSIKTISYGFLRGLDGMVPGATKQDTVDKDKAKDTGKNAKYKIEHPAGTSQADYLRRVALALKQHDRELRATGERLKAIAVLGNDYHDKLMVWEAMRPLFPEVVFFTNGLDANMLHPYDNQWTRNLVVADGLGLTLADKWQQDAPPFRDSLQTSVFLATAYAMRPTGKPPKLAPQIYEIGRHRAVEMAGGESRADVYPAPESHVLGAATKTYGLFAVITLFILLAFLRSSFATATSTLIQTTWHSCEKAKPARRWSFLVIAFMGVGVVSWCINILRRMNTAHLTEPFSWLEGVSMWPGEIIRLLALLTAIGLLVHGWRRVKENERKLEDEYFPVPSERRKAARKRLDRIHLRKIWRSYWSLKRMLCYELHHFFQPVRKTANIDVDMIWAQHRQPNSRKRQVAALLIPSVLYCIAAVLILAAGGVPFQPARGAGVRYVDYSLLIITVITFILLLFFVVDVTRRTCGMAVRLHGETRWPKETLERFGLLLPSSLAQYQISVSEWLNVRFLAERTSAVGSLIYYPIIIILMLIAARSSLFDAWTLPYHLLAVCAVSTAYALACALLLRRNAEAARRQALERTQGDLIRLRRGKPDEERSALIAQLSMLHEQIRTLREGSFSPISEQPVVNAILTMVGGLSGLSLIEHMATAPY